MEQEKVRYKPIVYVVGLVAALAGLLFGLDIGVISGALKFISADFGLEQKTGLQEMIVSSLLYGAALGALISGFFTRRFGRKNTLLIASVLFAAGSVGSSVATSAGVLITVRVFLGVAVGMASFTAPLYLSEISPPGVRGALVSMYQLLITIGILLAYLSDTYFASYATISGHTGGHWRLMLGILVIPATIMFLGIFMLPRSPRWLVLKGKNDAARKVLERMRNAPEEISRELADIEESVKVEHSGVQLFLKNRHFRKVVFLGVGLQIIQQLTGMNVIMYYAPKIFEIAGFNTTLEQMWGTVLVGLVNVLSTFIAIAFVDRWGRKPIMYAGFAVMGLSMCTVGILMKVGLESVQPNPALAFVTIAFLLFFIVGFAFSAGPIIWVLCSEIYPLAGRDLGITASTATNWIFNGIVGMSFLTLLNTIGHGNTFLLYGGLEVVFVIFFILFVPETKGVSLEKIEENLLSGKKLKDIGNCGAVRE